MTRLVDGLPDYERMMTRSLALWENVLREIRDDLKLEDPALPRVLALLRGVAQIRLLLPADPGPLRDQQGIWKELERELDSLHKEIVHALHNREYAHRKIRVIEELHANLKLLHLSDTPTP